MVKGKPKSDAIAVSELSAEILGFGTWSVGATIRFVDTEQGTTDSSCKRQGPWSEDTFKKLKELVESRERDMAKVLLKDPVIDEAVEKKGLEMKPDPDAGLGEHIGQESI